MCKDEWGGARSLLVVCACLGKSLLPPPSPGRRCLGEIGHAPITPPASCGPSNAQKRFGAMFAISLCVGLRPFPNSRQCRLLGLVGGVAGAIRACRRQVAEAEGFTKTPALSTSSLIRWAGGASCRSPTFSESRTLSSQQDANTTSPLCGSRWEQFVGLIVGGFRGVWV